MKNIFRGLNKKKQGKTKQKMQKENEKILEDGKQHKESKYKCHEDVYEDMYDGFVPVDDMYEEDIEYENYGDRD